MSAESIIRTSHLNLWYREKSALTDVSMEVPDRGVTALIGPSGCGKSTLIRCFNRMNDLVNICRITGRIDFHGNDIYAKESDPVEIRRKIGMVFQKPNPFPKSVYENVAYGPRVHGINDKKRLDEIVEREPPACCALGRGEGSPPGFGDGPFRGAAAASLHCTDACRRTRR